MMFKAAKSGGSFSLISPGEYEAYVSKAGIYKTKAGKDFISLEFTIRNDVDQKFKNRRISKPYFKDYETGDYRKNADGEYWFCVDAVTLGIEPGSDFNLEDLTGLSGIIVVGHYDSNDGKKECVNAIRSSRVNPLMSNVGIGNAKKDSDDWDDDEDGDFDGDAPF